MKRNVDLVRLLLITYESGEEPAELKEFSEQEIMYHLVLMKDAGLIDAEFVYASGTIPETAINMRLTWSGHDFLDSARDNNLWNKAKQHVLKPGASWTFNLLSEWLKNEIKQRLFGDLGKS